MVKNINLEGTGYLQEMTEKLARPLGASELYEKLASNFDMVMEVYKSISPLSSYFDELSKAVASNTAMFAALESPSISRIKALTGSMQIENRAIEAYKNIFESAEQPALSKLHERSAAAIAVSKAFQFPELQKLVESLSFQNLFNDQHQKVFSDAAAASSISHLSKAFNYSPLFNDDILKTQGVIQSLLEEVSLSDIDSADFSNYESLDNELQAELAEAKNFELLSPQAKKYVFAVLIFLLALFKDLSIALFGSYAYENYIKASEKLENITNKSELKYLLKGGDPTVDSKALGDYRVISKDKVNFREEPSMQSMVMLELPAFTLVKVLDKSQRSWLKIEVELGGETLQGWVNRRYTEYFR